MVNVALWLVYVSMKWCQLGVKAEAIKADFKPKKKVVVDHNAPQSIYDTQIGRTHETRKTLPA